MASCFESFRIFATKNSFKRLIYSSVFAIYYYGTDTVLTTKILKNRSTHECEYEYTKQEWKYLKICYRYN